MAGDCTGRMRAPRPTCQLPGGRSRNWPSWTCKRSSAITAAWYPNRPTSSFAAWCRNYPKIRGSLEGSLALGCAKAADCGYGIDHGSNGLDGLARIVSHGNPCQSVKSVAYFCTPYTGD